MISDAYPLRYGLSVTHRRLVFALSVCFVLVAIAYFYATFRVFLIKDRIRETGIEITKELSRLVSLPLLEENTQSIQNLFSHAEKYRNIVYGSVLDHRKALVTRIGDGDNVPVRNGEGRSENQVWFWESELLDNRKVVSFSSDVMYAGIKIGEIYIALPGPEPSLMRNQFFIAIASIFLLSTVFFVGWHRRDILSGSIAFMGKNRTTSNTQFLTDPVLTDAFVTCPLCGTRKAFSSEVFNCTHHEDVFLFKVTKRDSDAILDNDSECIQLTEVNQRDDLSWLKRQVILRCSEIIMKLTK